MANDPTRFDLGFAAAEVARLADGVEDAQLSNPTPAGWSVAELLDHLLGLAGAFRRAAEKATDPDDGPPAPPSADLPEGWRDELGRRLESLAAAWRAPSAWEGTTAAGGVLLPAAVIASVALDELVLHGWDLARGTEQGFRSRPSDVEVVLAFTSASAEPGREAERQGLFGAVVEVPADAPALHRALGYAGRDPSWRRTSATATGH